MSHTQRFTTKEEWANAISHGLGVIFGIVALVVMISTSLTHQNAQAYIISSSIFGGGLIVLFLSSTLNHSLPNGTKIKDFFHNFDQIAIYFLIAGTYTPIALVALKGAWGWSMFGIQWGFALAGIIAKTLIPNKFEKGVNIFVIISYVFMGWLILYFLYPCFQMIPTMGMVFIFIGGGTYTLGIIFFKLENKLKYSHLIWHLFVLGGAVCHWLAVWLYVLPLNNVPFS